MLYLWAIIKYKKILDRLNLTAYYGNLLPIYNWRTYALFREKLKNEVNEWINSQENLIDFESEVGVLMDSSWHFKDGYDSGDHLHPSKEAYKAMGILAAECLFKDKS